MRYKYFLNEQSSNNVISVDVQPMYKSYINFNIGKYFDWLSQQKQILFMFNGPDTVGGDSKNKILEWIVYDYMFPEDKLDDVYFIDKGYGFFRNWMDIGIPERDIKKILKYMLKNRINDSREITSEKIEELIGDNDIYHDDMIYIPDIPINLLKRYNGSYIVGGSKNECLKEVQILMDIHNIRYKEFRQYIY